MTHETYARYKFTARMIVAVFALGAFITFVFVLLPANERRLSQEAQHHRELIAAVEQMMYICAP